MAFGAKVIFKFKLPFKMEQENSFHSLIFFGKEERLSKNSYRRICLVCGRLLENDNRTHCQMPASGNTLNTLRVRYGRDALSLTLPAYNVSVGRLLGYDKHPKSKLLRKIEAGDRSIYREYASFADTRERP